MHKIKNLLKLGIFKISSKQNYNALKFQIEIDECLARNEITAVLEATTFGYELTKSQQETLTSKYVDKPHTFPIKYQPTVSDAVAVMCTQDVCSFLERLDNGMLRVGERYYTNEAKLLPIDFYDSYTHEFRNFSNDNYYYRNDGFRGVRNTRDLFDNPLFLSTLLDTLTKKDLGTIYRLHKFFGSEFKKYLEPGILNNFYKEMCKNPKYREIFEQYLTSDEVAQGIVKSPAELSKEIQQIVGRIERRINDSLKQDIQPEESAKLENIRTKLLPEILNSYTAVDKNFRDKSLDGISAHDTTMTCLRELELGLNNVQEKINRQRVDALNKTAEINSRYIKRELT